MNQTDFEKRLLQEKIDSQRKLLRAEIDAIAGQIRPVALLASWGRTLVPLWSSLDAALRSIRLPEDSRWGRWLRLAPLALLALPLVKLFKKNRE